VTFHGLRHGVTRDFLESVFIYSDRTQNFSIASDGWTAKSIRETLSPLNVINDKKETTFKIQYLQARVRDLASRLIAECKIKMLAELPAPAPLSPHFSSPEQLDPASLIHHSTITDAP
jgi:hypothetical protein